MKPFFSRARHVVAALALLLAADAAANPFETLLDANARTPRVIRANRDGGIATLYDTSFNSPHTLFFFRDGVANSFDVPGVQYVDLSLSNWGAAILDFQGPGTAIAAAPFGQAPRELFRAATNTSEAGINDAGQIALFGRESNGHGLRDAYFSEQGRPVAVLPDLMEDSIFGPPLVDASGRVVARHRIDSPFSSDPLDADVYRYTDGQGWENLTAGRLPADTTLSLSAGLPPEGAISPEGDFIFGGTRNPGSRQERRSEILLWDDSEQTIIPVLDHTSAFSGFGGIPFTLSTISAQFSTDNDLWVAASRFTGAGAEFVSLYRTGDGAVIDLAALLPAGQSLLPDVNAYTLNHDGDLWLTALDDATNLRTYYLLQDGELRPVLEDTDQVVFQPALTNNHELFFWARQDDGLWDLLRLQVPPVPEPSTLLLAGGLASVGLGRPRRNRCRKLIGSAASL